jgi:hypothetical protein
LPGKREFEPIIQGTEHTKRQLCKGGLASFQAKSSLKNTIIHILTCFSAGNKETKIKYIAEKIRMVHGGWNSLVLYNNNNGRTLDLCACLRGVLQNDTKTMFL